MIIEKIKELIKEVTLTGIKDVNGTTELQNVICKFYPNTINLDAEKNNVKNYYNKNIGNYSNRENLEKTHYDRLTADIIHEITRNQWFTNLDKKIAIDNFITKFNIVVDRNLVNEFKNSFNLENFTGRRNVVSGFDCISNIQFLSRQNINILSVTMRSSDIINLLPIDILFINTLLIKILDFYNINKNIDDEVFIHIVSAHIYNNNKNIVDKILYEKNNN